LEGRGSYHISRQEYGQPGGSPKALERAVATESSGEDVNDEGRADENGRVRRWRTATRSGLGFRQEMAQKRKQFRITVPDAAPSVPAYHVGLRLVGPARPEYRERLAVVVQGRGLYPGCSQGFHERVATKRNRNMYDVGLECLIGSYPRSSTPRLKRLNGCASEIFRRCSYDIAGQHATSGKGPMVPAGRHDGGAGLFVIQHAANLVYADHGPEGLFLPAGKASLATGIDRRRPAILYGNANDLPDLGCRDPRRLLRHMPWSVIIEVPQV
jgi:hypothetical protein